MICRTFTAVTEVAAFVLTGLMLACALPPAAAQDGDKPYQPPIAGKSNEGSNAIEGFKIPPGFKVELFAAEPDVANPVAFSIDEKGRLFVCETFRQGDKGGVVDNRNHMYWINDELAMQSVEDRRKLFLKYRKDQVKQWTTHHDRIRLLEDTDGDHKADRSIVFSDGYHDLLDGTGASVLAHRGNVYYTCIPKLYLLRDTNNDGKADQKQVLSEGYGVKVALRGHDLHGLTIGPDGRLYFSIGDRGYNIVTKEGKHLKDVNSGAVFRCELDGSNLEVVHTGLRNPQELVFDDYGNLFAGDNNSDAGDRARWVYIVEGGQTGWRMSYQYLPDRGPWNREGWWHLWDPNRKDSPAFLVPPIAHIGNGPSGVTYYPGTGFGDDYRGTFFMCDFKGTSAVSGIHSFHLKPRGAWFEMIDRKRFIWNTLATDADFGYDGALYFTDWVHGWEGEGKGRVYRLFNPKHASDKTVAQTKKLFAEGFEQRRPDELATLLNHPDRRVRLAAQFALVDKQEANLLLTTVVGQQNVLARLHAIWGGAQLLRRASGDKAAAAARRIIDAGLSAKDDEVRAAAARFTSDRGTLLSSLSDPSPRVRFFAAIQIGKSRAGAGKSSQPVVDALLDLLRDNDDKDPYLRHACVMGLTYLGDANEVTGHAADKSRAVRMGVLLALRRLNDQRTARFLNDADEGIVIEAARAINDEPVEGARPALAKVLERKDALKSGPLLRRAINANWWLGGAQQAERLAKFAARADMPALMRVEALAALRDWKGDPQRDRVLNVYRPVKPRPADQARTAAQRVIVALLADRKDDAMVRRTAADVLLAYPTPKASPTLRAIVLDATQPTAVRVASLRALGTIADKHMLDAVKAALKADNVELRKEAHRWLAKVKPAEAVPVLESVLNDKGGAAAERQAAFATLASMKHPGADTVLLKWLDLLLAGKVELALQLDLIEAARRRNSDRMKLKLAAWDAAMPKDDPLKSRRHLLEGGDAEAGRRLFWKDQRAACQRCHKIGGEGAGEAGPDLAKIGAKQKRQYLLESILYPNRQITKGFDTFYIETNGGERIVGVLRQETGKALIIVTPANQRVTVLKSDIAKQRKTKSAMPEDVAKLLGDRSVRDLVEFLAQLK